MKFELDSGISGTLCVCNTIPPNSVVQSNKRSIEDDDTPGIMKRLRTDQLEDSNQCETHLKEIKRLKEELSQRDEEISNLNKLIAALTRKQGL